MPEWERVREILALALEQDSDVRATFIRDACGTDRALRAEIESLASHFEGADSLLEHSPTANLLSFGVDVMAGKRIGTWRIVRMIGQGGMAVVYLAERDDPDFRKTVAIKMVRPGPNTEEIYRRFRNERQTLAALDHPYIVRLLDGGSSADGIPYLVMDYVEGLPVNRYCDQHELAIDRRLDLFRDICSAVHYAHEKQVIHRDLKPANILVTNEGVPRLLDFGIAKLLNPDLHQTELVTRTSIRPMTLEYASPEQVRGHPITRASDTYSLGVLLYELLTGYRPYRCGESQLELERAICDDELEKPSSAVTRAGIPVSRGIDTAMTPEMVSKARGLARGELRRRLQGDLDAIVMKALRKEAQSRYSSAKALSEDIERLQTGKRVTARNLTVAYRGARFLRRHRESAAAIAIALVVIGGLVTWEEHRASRQVVSQPQPNTPQVHVRPALAILGFNNLSNRADTAWVSTALSEMLARQLAAGEELRTVPGETVARTRIDLGLSDMESVSHEVLDRIRRNLGSDFVVLGSYADSGRQSGGQIRLNLRLQNAVTKDTVATVSEMGNEGQLLDLVSRTGSRLRERLGLSRVSALEAQAIQASVASNPGAMQLYSQGLITFRAFDSLIARDLLARAVTADPSFPFAHSALALAWQALGYDNETQAEAKRALDFAGALSREDNLMLEARYYEASRNWPKAIDTYKTLSILFPDNLDYGMGLARAQSSSGKGKEALATLTELTRVSTYAKDDPQVDLALADAAASTGDDKLRRDSADRAAAKADHQGARLLVARARATECRALANLGDNDRANVACDEARRIYADAGDRGGLARALHASAEIPLNQGDYATAERLYRQALAILERIGDKTSMGSELVNLGVIYVRRGDFVQGRSMYARALRSYQESGDKNGIVVVTGNTGNLLRAEGRMSEALASYETALKLSTELGHRGSEALCLQAIGDVQLEKGDLSNAVEDFNRAMGIQQAIGAKSNYASTLVSAGEAWRQQGETTRALDAEQEALTIQQQLGEKGSAAETRVALAELAYDSGKLKDAEALARTALEEFRTEKEPVQEIGAEGLLSRSLIDQGRISEAEESVGEAFSLSKETPEVIRGLSIRVDDAYLLTALKTAADAESVARKTMSEALKLGLIRLYLEASLALRKAELQSSRGEGRLRLQRLAKEAQARGFVLIAQEASAPLEDSTPGVK
jgi:serine/threonine protein kinase/tetratricopeptide (TPR) repeat protein/TolB-like protein